MGWKAFIVALALASPAQAAGVGGTTQAGQSNPSLAMNVASAPSTTSATITWVNNPSAEAQVCYGTTTGYGTCTTRDSSPVTSDSATISGLSSGTLYHYQINNLATGYPQGFSPDQTFTTTSSSSAVAFSLPTGDVIHYISPTGSDGANGLTTGTPWATPNHALNCGDVIIAASGSYTSGFGTWGTVSNCPSTSGGIDGTGGVYFATLLCGGADLESCKMSISSGQAFSMRSDNWAVEGWKTTTAGAGDAYIMSASATGTTQLHHIAFINDICFNSSRGIVGDEGALNHNNPGNGIDYNAFVGDLAQNCAASGLGVSNFDMIAPSQWDANSGTHIFVDGNFSIAATFPGGGSTDAESYMFDTIDAHGYAAQIVASNNIGFDATRECIQFTYGGWNPATTPTLKVYNFSCYGNNQNFTTNDNGNGELDFGYNNSNPGATTSPFILSMTNNLAQTSKAAESIYETVTIGGTALSGIVTSGSPTVLLSASATVANGATITGTGIPASTTIPTGGTGTTFTMSANATATSQQPIYGLTLGGVQWTALTDTGNFFNGSATICHGSPCFPTSAPYSAAYFNSNAHSTTDTYTTVGYTNTTDLMSNQTGVPNCTGFTTTAACMGWNAITSTLTTPSVISDLVATASGTSGKGYQLPSITCAANADYPTWLKGIVYLQWNGSSLTENADLVTKPCGL